MNGTLDLELPKKNGDLLFLFSTKKINFFLIIKRQTKPAKRKGQKDKKCTKKRKKKRGKKGEEKKVSQALRSGFSKTTTKSCMTSRTAGQEKIFYWQRDPEVIIILLYWVN